MLRHGDQCGSSEMALHSHDAAVYRSGFLIINFWATSFDFFHLALSRIREENLQVAASAAAAATTAVTDQNTLSVSGSAAVVVVVLTMNAFVSSLSFTNSSLCKSTYLLIHDTGDSN